LLLLTLKKGSKTDQLLDKLNPITRFEDTIEVLPDDRIGIIMEDQGHISDPLRVAKRLKEAAGKQVQEVAIVDLDGTMDTARQYFDAAAGVRAKGEPTFHDQKADEDAKKKADEDAKKKE